MFRHYEPSRLNAVDVLLNHKFINFPHISLAHPSIRLTLRVIKEKAPPHSALVVEVSKELAPMVVLLSGISITI